MTETLPDREGPMDFGYFTLSDNHYENNTRSSNQFVAELFGNDHAHPIDQIGQEIIEIEFGRSFRRRAHSAVRLSPYCCIDNRCNINYCQCNSCSC